MDRGVESASGSWRQWWDGAKKRVGTYEGETSTLEAIMISKAVQGFSHSPRDSYACSV